MTNKKNEIEQLTDRVTALEASLKATCIAFDAAIGLLRNRDDGARAGLAALDKKIAAEIDEANRREEEAAAINRERARLLVGSSVSVVPGYSYTYLPYVTTPGASSTTVTYSRNIVFAEDI